MSRWDQETFRAGGRQAVLAIACEPELLARLHAAAAFAGAIVKEAAAIGEAVSIATATKPLAIVVEKALFARYVDEFRALSDEIAATLVTLPPQISQTDLEKLLVDAVEAAMKKRDAALPH